MANPWRHRLKKEKFGALQKLRAGYLDGQISVDSSEVFSKYIGDFDFNKDDYPL
jgi:hypothetical protein